VFDMADAVRAVFENENVGAVDGVGEIGTGVCARPSVLALLTGLSGNIPKDVGAVIDGDKVPPIFIVGAEYEDPPKKGSACAVYGNVTWPAEDCGPNVPPRALTVGAASVAAPQTDAKTGNAPEAGVIEAPPKPP
jgi:hypothetical protein